MRIPIRAKLAAALALPLVVANAVSLFGVYQSRQQASSAERQAELATASLGPDALITGLRLESSASAVTAIGLPTSILQEPDLRSLRASVDGEVKGLRPFVDAHGPAVAAAYRPVFTALAGLPAIRSQLDRYQGVRSLTNPAAVNLSTQVLGAYSSLIHALLNANSGLALGVSDAMLRNGAELLSDQALNKQQSSDLISGIGSLIESGKTITLDDAQSLAEQYGQFLQTEQEIANLATGPYAAALPRSQAPFEKTVVQVLTGHPIGLQQLVSSSLGGPGTTDASNEASTQAAATILTARAHSLTHDATDRERGYELLALTALLLAVLTTVLASRSITGPLRSLTEQAAAMADDRLPLTVQDILTTPLGQDVVLPTVEPVAVRSRDEVADVAMALNTVQTRAIGLAVEQAALRRNIADSFVNLGRRTQNLIGRQLEFITELEHRETDPDTLSELFRLDHLATRMRRNAESLVVLAGTEPARPWSGPVSLADVVRAALAEVEDYQRVRLRPLGEVVVIGAVAADLAHLLAELLENGLAFSPPESAVEVTGRAVPGGYALTVTDEGLGMAAPELDRANARLAGAESFTVAPSRYLGHYVAGHLAQRLGVTVSLKAGSLAGTVAHLMLPAAILAVGEAPTSRSVAGAAAWRGPAADHAVATPAPLSLVTANGPSPAPAVVQPDRPPRTRTSGPVPAELPVGSLAPPVTIGPAMPGGIPAPPRLPTPPSDAVPAPPAAARFGSGPGERVSASPPPAAARFGSGPGDGLPASPPLRHLEPAAPGAGSEAPGTTRSGLSRRIRGAHGAGDVAPSLLRGAEEPVSADVDVLDFFAGYQRGEGEDR